MSSVGRKRDKSWTTTQEDAALDNIARRAEEILQEKRKERDKARKIRMDELEKKNKEDEEQLDRHYDLMQKVSVPGNGVRSYVSSTHDADDTDSKDLKTVHSELEEKYRRAMISNCQLDNEKQALSYHVDLLKDQLEDLEERGRELEREAKDKHRALGEEKRTTKDLQQDLLKLKTILQHREELIKEHGMVLLEADMGSSSTQANVDGDADENRLITAVLISQETAEMLNQLAPPTLDEKIKTVATENVKLKAELKTLRAELEDEREKAIASRLLTPPRSTYSQINGADSPDVQLLELQRESSRQISEYKLKVQKAENDIGALESNILRLEAQVKRFREQAEASERAEDELKSEKRKLQKQLREAQQQIEELENQKKHLQNRLDKIRQARKEVLGNSS